MSSVIIVLPGSPRRGETFVTRNITRVLGRIKMGLRVELCLGELDARREKTPRGAGPDLGAAGRMA